MQAVRFLLLLFFVLGFITIIGCKEDPTGPPQVVTPGDNEEIIYSKHIHPIFANSCAGADCHVGDRAADLSLESWERMVEGSEFGSVVVPFSAHRSHLFQHINTDTTLGPFATPRMPLSLDPLPIEQIKTIMRWINEGAKNDAGEIPLAGETRPKIFVTCQSEDMVCAIDLETEMVARYIETGSRPNETSPPEATHNIVLSPDERFFYINLIASGVVEKFDAQMFEKLGEVQVGLSPAQIRVTDDGSTLYVSNFDLTFQQEFVNRVDAATMTNTTSIDIEGKAPHGVTLSTDERYLYTMNAGSDDISKVDLTIDEVVQRIPIVPGSPPAAAGAAQHEPYQSVIAPNGLMFVTCRKSGQVRVVDLIQGKVVDSIVVGSRPLIPALHPNGKELWVPNQGSNTVSIIDVETHQVIATIPGMLAQPHAIAFTASGDRAFISCENQAGGENLHHPLEGTDVVPGIVYTINTNARVITKVIEVAGFAAGIVIKE